MKSKLSEDSGEQIEEVIEGTIGGAIEENTTSIFTGIVERTFEKKTIIFSGTISSNIIYSVFYPLKYLVDLGDPEPIHLYINTEGGDATAALFLSSYIQSSKVPIYVYAMGEAFSGGAIILFSGHKRFCYKYSTIMFHLPSGDFEASTSKSLEHRLKSLKIMDSYFLDLIKTKTKISQEELEPMLDLDWYLTPGECLKYGFIDEIIS